MQNVVWFIVLFLVGCIDCDIILCPIDPGGDGGVEIDTGTGEIEQDCVYVEYFNVMVWRCNCSEDYHCIGCPGDVCIFTLTGDDADIECPVGSQCQLLCDPNTEPNCHFDVCVEDLRGCSRYGEACNYWCPNT
jgi:hypothetical protein